MRNRLFMEPTRVRAREWGAIAEAAGLRDTAALIRCIEDRRYSEVVVQDTTIAKSIGALGTPTVVFDNLRFGIPPTLAALEKMVKKDP